MIRHLHLFLLVLTFSGVCFGGEKDYTLEDYARLRDSAQVLWHEYARNNNITSLETLSPERYQQIVDLIKEQLSVHFHFVKTLTRQEDIILNGFLNRQKAINDMADSPDRINLANTLEMEKKIFFNGRWEEYQKDKTKFIKTTGSE